MRSIVSIGCLLGLAGLLLGGCDQVQREWDVATGQKPTQPTPRPVRVQPEATPTPEPPPPPSDPDILLDLSRWDAASSAAREDAARAIDPRAPRFAFLRLQAFEAGGQKHEVAIFQHERTGLEFSLLPAGTFKMGSPSREEGRQADETVREVTLSRPFFIARTEVTQASWRAVMKKYGPAVFEGDDRPIENVNMGDIPRYLFRAKLDLPTEAQWEYACRAGTTTAFACGKSTSSLGDYAWLETNSNGTTHPVAQKRPNAFGLHDVHGNVWERCSDMYASRGASAVTDPEGPSDGGDQVVRGGSWGNLPAVLRSAFRYRMHPGDKHGGVGFRPVKTLPRP